MIDFINSVVQSWFSSCFCETNFEAVATQLWLQLNSVLFPLSKSLLHIIRKCPCWDVKTRKSPRLDLSLLDLKGLLALWVSIDYEKEKEYEVKIGVATNFLTVLPNNWRPRADFFEKEKNNLKSS